jgi:GTP cyclohydrolase I
LNTSNENDINDYKLVNGNYEDEHMGYQNHSKNGIKVIPSSEGHLLKEDGTGSYMINGYNQKNDSNGRKLYSHKTYINKNNIEKLIRHLLVELGEDPDREGLSSTPRRIANMCDEIFAGYRAESGMEVSFTEETDMIIAKDIQFYTMCEHHMLPFYGKIHIAYVPHGKVFGISKLVRLVEKYARRLQIQERLTKDVANEIDSLGVKGVMVIAEGEHLCMRMRGVRSNSSIITTASRGIIKEQKDVRQNIISLLS